MNAIMQLKKQKREKKSNMIKRLRGLYKKKPKSNRTMRKLTNRKKNF